MYQQKIAGKQLEHISKIMKAIKAIKTQTHTNTRLMNKLVSFLKHIQKELRK